MSAATILFLGYAMVVKTLFPADTPTVTIARTREDGYQVMRRFLLASGATEADNPIGIHHGPCGSDRDPRRPSQGYYSIAVFGGFKVVGDDQNEAFRRMYEHARAHGFRVTAYENPSARAQDGPGDSAIGTWRLNGGVPGDHGFGFSIFTVRPHNHVAVWVTSTCRVTPDRDEDSGIYTLPSLLPNVPPAAPLWTAPPPEPPPAADPAYAPDGRGTPPPSPPPAPPPAAVSDAQALARIRDLLG